MFLVDVHSILNLPREVKRVLFEERFELLGHVVDDGSEQNVGNPVLSVMKGAGGSR